MKKQYIFIVSERKAFDGTTFPDYVSNTYKSKRKTEAAMYDFEILPGIICGGSATLQIMRVR